METFLFHRGREFCQLYMKTLSRLWSEQSKAFDFGKQYCFIQKIRCRIFSEVSAFKNESAKVARLYHVVDALKEVGSIEYLHADFFECAHKHFRSK